jgi:hypothetical protein
MFTHPWPAMYMYFYTTQQNKYLRVRTLNLSQLSKNILISGFCLFTLLLKMFLGTTLDSRHHV